MGTGRVYQCRDHMRTPVITAAVKEGSFMLIFLFLQVEKVRLLDRVSPRRSRVGTLYLTATHTIFVEEEAEVRGETWVGTCAGARNQTLWIANNTYCV